jgi:hypothetical protein
MNCAENPTGVFAGVGAAVFRLRIVTAVISLKGTVKSSSDSVIRMMYVIAIRTPKSRACRAIAQAYLDLHFLWLIEVSLASEFLDEAREHVSEILSIDAAGVVDEVVPRCFIERVWPDLSWFAHLPLLTFAHGLLTWSPVF